MGKWGGKWVDIRMGSYLRREMLFKWGNKKMMRKNIHMCVRICIHVPSTNIRFYTEGFKTTRHLQASHFLPLADATPSWAARGYPETLPPQPPTCAFFHIRVFPHLCQSPCGSQVHVLNASTVSPLFAGRAPF